MTDFVPGQRWVNDAELQLGLGTVISVEPRRVTLMFFSTGETRTYASQTAPLTRVRFSVGDSIRTHDGRSFRIEQVQEQEGILSYWGQDAEGRETRIGEAQLDHFLRLNKPAERLFSGQIDLTQEFELRYHSLRAIDQIGHSPLRGLTGGRTSLIPHQLFIAREVAKRYAPRVLLADEVGLGKTIEAGMILHQQLLNGRVQRVLILVPDSLLHQWLVEMLRRFNLSFSIFNADRFKAPSPGYREGNESETTPTPENPFLAQQLVLCSLEFLCRSPELQSQALAGEWDMLIVDEAHHLQWSPARASAEYLVVEQLARLTKAVLLLTATPEQLGKAGHFARLRLLDPERFPDYESFLGEEAAYEPIARAIGSLLQGEPLAGENREVLAGSLAEQDNQALFKQLSNPKAEPEQRMQATHSLIEHLLDRHGTGRVLFRNSRHTLHGFPARKLHPYPLDAPAGYPAPGASDPRPNPLAVLYPEHNYPEHSHPEHSQATQDSWLELDPRVGWLLDLAAELKGQKLLVICAQAATAMQLAAVLRQRRGIHAALFHEGMSIIERDKAAAYFADPDYGAQFLICSEIGSEGRNFQFAHHLALFDLPFDPDLLEQRIGRLDRIGQSQNIHIHVPYLQGSGQEALFLWYQQGLDAFERHCPAGHSLFTEFAPRLGALITGALDRQQLELLLSATRSRRVQLEQALARGRDRLLEYNSCRPAEAQALARQAVAEDEATELAAYMELAYDCFGIDLDSQSEHLMVIRPSEAMLVPLPHLPDDGLTVTYDRATALANEDIAFLSWDHPLVRSSLDMILSSEFGNTALVTATDTGAKAGTLLLECLFILESPDSSRLQLSRYLPASLLRVLVDEAGKLYPKLSFEAINARTKPVDRKTAAKVIRAKQKSIEPLLRACEKSVSGRLTALRDQAQQQASATLSAEYERLKALRQLNPMVRDEEIAFYRQQLQEVQGMLEKLSPRLDALRVVIAL